MHVNGPDRRSLHQQAPLPDIFWDETTTTSNSINCSFIYSGVYERPILSDFPMRVAVSAAKLAHARSS